MLQRGVWFKKFWICIVIFQFNRRAGSRGKTLQIEFVDMFVCPLRIGLCVLSGSSPIVGMGCWNDHQSYEKLGVWMLREWFYLSSWCNKNIKMVHEYILIHAGNKTFNHLQPVRKKAIKLPKRLPNTKPTWEGMTGPLKPYPKDRLPQRLWLED